MSFLKIAERLDLFRDEMIDLQIKLASIPAIAPSSGGEGEARKAEAILEALKTSGFQEIEVVKTPDLDAPAGYRPNILAFYRGRSSARTTWIMTHMDIVPPGEMSLWKGDPFKPWIESGKIYGRGVEDNQQDLVASIYAVKAIAALGLKPAFDVGLAIVSDEETGSEKGIPHVLKHSNAFRRGDLIIVPDTGNSDGTEIEVAEKSILWLKFKVLGRQTHGSTPERGLNAFKAAIQLAARLDKLYAAFPATNPLFLPPISTFEPTKKEANVPNINTIPGEDVFYMDCRILPQYSLEDVEDKIHSAIRAIEKETGVTIGTENMQRAAAAPPTAPDAPVVQALKKAVGAVYQKESRAVGIGGGTVAAFFRKQGFEAACWSKIDETAHQPNEYCIIDNMVGDAKVFAHVMMQE
jgi:succinyl-diaminopimelate desuccinylase